MQRLTSLSSVVLFSILFYSCGGDLKKQDIEKSAISLPLECELDSEAFSQITNRDITTELNCLKSTLDLFLEAVKIEDPNKLPRDILINFIKQQIPEKSEELAKGIKILYSFSVVAYAGDGKHLSKQDLWKIIDFAKILNTELVKSYFYLFEDESMHPLEWHKSKRGDIQVSIKKVLESFKATFSKGEGEVSLNLFDLLNLFETQSNVSNIELIKQLLKVRRFFSISDIIQTINQKELVQVLDSFIDLGPLLFDAFRYKYIDFSNFEEKIKFLKSNLKVVRRHINIKDSPDRVYLSWTDILELTNALRKSGKEVMDLAAYEEEVKKIKKIFLSDSIGADFRGKDFSDVFNEIGLVLDKGLTLSSIYNEYKTLIETSGEIEQSSLDQIKSYKTKNSFEKEIRSDLVRVLKDYRLFKGEKLIAQFKQDRGRSFHSVYEIFLFEYLVKKLYAYYEPRFPCDNPEFFDEKLLCVDGEDYKKTLTEYQIEKILYDLSGILGEVGVTAPGIEASVAQSLTLVTSLFQFQSNGDGLMTVQEMSEFLIIVYTSMGVSQGIYDEALRYCPVKLGGVERSCLYNSMFSVLWNSEQADFRSFFPGLYQFSSGLNDNETYDYLDKVTRFSIPCHEFSNGELIPMSKGNIQTMLIALMSVENIILRYDKSENGLLEWDETKYAYDSNFVSAIEGFMKEPIDLINSKLAMLKIIKPLEFEATAYKIFEYLVRYEKVPNTKKIGDIFSLGKWLFITPKKSRRTTGGRQTLSSILKIIKEGSKEQLIKDRGMPPVNCDYLKER